MSIRQNQNGLSRPIPAVHGYCKGVNRRRIIVTLGNPRVPLSGGQKGMNGETHDCAAVTCCGTLPFKGLRAIGKRRKEIKFSGKI